RNSPRRHRVHGGKTQTRALLFVSCHYHFAGDSVTLTLINQIGESAMHKNKLDLTLAMGLLLGVVLACGATTANISSLKVSTDEQGKNEAKSFKPGDKVYAVAQIANNGGTVQAKFRILYDHVEGETAGTLVQGAYKTLE